MLDAERTKIVALALARGREHFHAHVLGQLDRRQPDSARAGVNQDPLARFQTRKLV